MEKFIPVLQSLTVNIYLQYTGKCTENVICLTFPEPLRNTERPFPFRYATERGTQRKVSTERRFAEFYLSVRGLG